MYEKSIGTVSQFVSAVFEIKEQQEANGNKSDLLFRGQPCDEPLTPRLGREKVRGKLPTIERLMLDKFNRESIPLREFEPKDDWDRLALAQHHGLSTRLLDRTRSATAALWFAVRYPAKKNESDSKPARGVVWVLCPTVEDYHQATDRTGPFDNKARTLIYRPKAIARRIVVQSGVFTVHKIIKGRRFVPLEENPRYADKLVKLVIPPSRFSRIRNELNMLNTNAAVLFPDLDGLCAHLAWRYTRFQDEPR